MTEQRLTWTHATALAILTLLLLVGPTLGAMRIGTDGPDTLTGTHEVDQIVGKGGNDLLKGLAGNDLYQFKDEWGQDRLVEQATYLVAGQTVSGGVDTLSFAQRSGWVTACLCRQWGSGRHRVFDGSGNVVNLGTSVVERVTGTTGFVDMLAGGGEANVLDTGGGNGDDLRDYGGWTPGPSTPPEYIALPESDDVFKGLARGTGNLKVTDYGGTADTVDLRPLASTDVYFDAIDMDGTPEEQESLQIVLNATTSVTVLGHFGEYYDYTIELGQQGRIERLVFADGVVSGAESASRTANSAQRTATSARQADLAKAGERMAAELRKELGPNPDPLPKRR